MLGVRIPADSDESVDIIYGNALAESLQEERINRKRKRNCEHKDSVIEKPTWSCFIVYPAVSSLTSPTINIKRCNGN